MTFCVANGWGWIAGLLVCIAATSSARAASPDVREILPRGGQRGTEIDVILRGDHLSDAQEILFYQAGLSAAKIEYEKKQVKARFRIAADAPLGQHALRLRTATGVSELRTFWVGPFPVVQEDSKQPPIKFESPQQIPLNVTVEGTINNEEADYFAVNAAKGQHLSVEVEGIRLGGAMFDPYIAIFDARHFQIAACDDTPLLKQDPFASIPVPKDGRYVVMVRDASFGGGANFHFRMHVGTFPRPHVIFHCGGVAGTSLAAQFLGDIGGTITQTLQLPSDAQGNVPFYAGQNGQSPPSPNYLRVDRFPDVLQVQPNQSIATATAATMDPPLAFEGAVTQPEHSDYYRFGAKKGQLLDLTVYARRLGSPLDSVLTLYDAGGKKLASNDDSGGPDSYLRFNPPADGLYVLGIRDQLRGGGPEYVYRIEVVPPAPSVKLSIPEAGRNGSPSQERQAIAVARGNRMATMIRLTRAGADGAMKLEMPDLPPGITMHCGVVDKNENTVPVIFEAVADAPVAGGLCTLLARPVDASEHWIGRFEQRIPLVVGQPNNTVYYETTVDQLAVAVTKEAPFNLEIQAPRSPIAQGGQMDLNVTARRRPGFDKPISLQLLYQPQGIGARGQADIAPGKTEATLQLSASAQSRVGKYPLIVLGWAEDDGKVWAASEPEELEITQPFVNLKIEMATAEQGQNAAVACTVENRMPFDGMAKAELLGLPVGATATPQEFSASDKRLVFNVAVDAKCPPGHSKTLFCRVTVVKDAQPIVQDLGQGGDLRIDAKSPPPKNAPAVSQGPATVPSQPLSRLDKLRQEQNRQ
jgi:hypothetical protein